jgi:hypothetical protein
MQCTSVVASFMAGLMACHVNGSDSNLRYKSCTSARQCSWNTDYRQDLSYVECTAYDPIVASARPSMAS